MSDEEDRTGRSAAFFLVSRHLFCCSAQPLARFGLEIRQRHVIKHRLCGMAQAIVDETDVRTPALIVSDGLRLLPPGLAFPEFLKVAVKLAQVAKLSP